MSELLLTEFPGDSSRHVNGLSPLTPVFIYDKETPLEVDISVYPPVYSIQEKEDKIAYSNYLYIKREMGMIDIENSIQQTIDFKYWTKKDESKKDKDFIVKKFIEIFLIHTKMCHFILSNLHSLTWKNYKPPRNGGAKYEEDYWNDVLSTINLKESIDLIKPAATWFYNILINITLKKYPDELSSASIRHHLDTQILEMKHRGLLDLTNTNLSGTKFRNNIETSKNNNNNTENKKKTKKKKVKKLKEENEDILNKKD